MENLKRFLSVKETADYLNISPRTIYNKTGRKAKVKFPVKAKRIGRCVRFDIKDLDAYIASI
jgi:excisionase family DNA binding protein